MQSPKNAVQTDNQDRTETKINRLIVKFSNGKRKATYQDSQDIYLRKNKDCFIISNLIMCLDSNKQPYISTNTHKPNLYPRYRRSQHVDPSDPLGSENPKSRKSNYRRQNQERERSSNVSKETITSCDDPLHVLLSKSPVSPNLQQGKRKKQVAPSELF